MRKKTQAAILDMIVSLEGLKEKLRKFSKLDLPCSVREEAEELDRHRKSFYEMLSSRCRHCDKKVPFGCNCCAPCADERGP